MEHICMNCVYSLKIEDMTYQCRRYAPRRLHGVGTGASDKMFPVMRLDDWCGEFYPKDEDQREEFVEE